MENSIGKRIAALRREKGYKQDDIAKKLNISPQAVSKWENDQSYPDISVLPALAEYLGVSVDELLTGKKEEIAPVRIVPEEERKNIDEMFFRIIVDSAEGDRIRVNLPMAFLRAAIEMGVEMPQVSGNKALQNIDFAQLLSMVQQGAVGNLVEVDSADGDTIRIFVE
ncbi:MAG: helix-turn-helix transcriptional regulator [Christensenellaceae bacterium]|nr:helix-turn-helix transcriptional regulator [Christensenellaceae bacterium]